MVIRAEGRKEGRATGSVNCRERTAGDSALTRLWHEMLSFHSMYVTPIYLKTPTSFEFQVYARRMKALNEQL